MTEFLMFYAPFIVLIVSIITKICFAPKDGTLREK